MARRNKNCCVRSVTVRKMGELSAIRNNGATRFSIQPWEQRRRNHESLKYIVLSLVAQVSWAAEELNDWWTDRGGWQENFERTEKNKYKGNFPWNKTSAEFNISFIDLLRLVLSIIIIARQQSVAPRSCYFYSCCCSALRRGNEKRSSILGIGQPNPLTDDTRNIAYRSTSSPSNCE